MRVVSFYAGYNDFMAHVTDFSLGTVEVALTPQARFEEYLRARGKKITQSRLRIVEHVSRQHDHFDADKLASELKASKATVYRALGDMVAAGLLRQMEIGRRKVYEHDYGYPQHEHLHCTSCDTLIEFSSAELLQIRDAVSRQHQFRPQSHTLIISGICADCRSGRSKSRHQDRV
jgi:Fur family transcriptional regulator, ferric uptake regulator